MQVPSACFVQPPLAYVGYTEEEAIAKCSGDIDVYISKFKPMKYTISGRDERTFMKLIVHAESDQVSIHTNLHKYVANYNFICVALKGLCLGA